MQRMNNNETNMKLKQRPLIRHSTHASWYAAALAICALSPAFSQSGTTVEFDATEHYSSSCEVIFVTEAAAIACAMGIYPLAPRVERYQTYIMKYEQANLTGVTRDWYVAPSARGSLTKTYSVFQEAKIIYGQR